MHLMEQGQLDLSDGNRKPASTEVQWNTPEVFTIITGFRLIHILALNLKHGPDSNKKIFKFVTGSMTQMLTVYCFIGGEG